MKKKHTRLVFIRIFLICLILLNMGMIYALSAQNAEKSTQTSEKLESVVLDTFLPNAEENPTDFTVAIQSRLLVFLRKSAHAIEFFTLGALTLLLLLTWRGAVMLRAAAALGFTVLYAISDEIHQLFIDGRTARFTDVLIDAAGALGGILLVLLIYTLIKHKKHKIKTTVYSLSLPIKAPLCIAVASDLHDCGYQETENALRALSPDLILLPGDLTDDRGLAEENAPVYAFLAACARIAPTYYAPGNHEIACYHSGNPQRHPTPIPLSKEAVERIKASGAVLLDNTFSSFGDLCICGLRSGINQKENHPDGEVLARFAALPGTRILLCHHPEYYHPYIKSTDIDLTVCGHAHGGQWRFFGRGIYAPGQGLFPKYTSGVIDGRCVISRGIGNHTVIPRICNAPELILIKAIPTCESTESLSGEQDRQSSF